MNIKPLGKFVTLKESSYAKIEGGLSLIQKDAFRKGVVEAIGGDVVYKVKEGDEVYFLGGTQVGEVVFVSERDLAAVIIS